MILNTRQSSAAFSVFLLIALTSSTGLIASANPAKPIQSTPLNELVEEMRSNCAHGNADSFECIKYKVINFLDTIFKKDNFKVTDDIEVRQNDYYGNTNEINGRSTQSSVIDTIEQYVQSHDVTFNVPIAAAKVTISPRNLNDDELNLKIKFTENNGGRAVADGEARKSKLKKIAVPIMVFILLKAMTLIPLALGVLGLKAWNALQLSFFAFVISTALAIFQLCKKIATDNHHPQIAAHGPWDRRSIDQVDINENAQNLAYNAYN